jgi:hypothetical protein
MAEREVQDSRGRIWDADTFALEHGHWHGEIEFAEKMVNLFGVHGYERMQQLWKVRDKSIRRHHRSGRPIPEGADINEFL